ncbi:MULTISPECIES: penicillin-binding protein activator LpoB [unclassified Massilia]|uniref:penicillin-binding protein activator LpoB n=1 Tax=unclassified Massilia TaxID=2609279 RepID=UPI001B8422ED|nr:MULTISPECIES: penicillin-binding protein activator LpoB [unclassified Massilia]MBQ5938890.1 penicillin-binding protein activator LpoB [Massilia sp. AB1]MBQ5961899.1 penicillin-binding protein activator LpoB [Massilia sp. ZL223]
MKTTYIAALAAVLALSGCATSNLNNSAGSRVVYQDVSTTSTQVAGVGMEAQDIVSSTDKMVRDILSNPAIAGRTTPPRIIIDSEYFANDSSSRVNKNLITDRLRIELNRAAQGRLVFVARHYGDMVSKEREAKRSGETDRGTIRSTKAKAGADFRLGGRITSLDANSARTGTLSRYHQISFELIDLEYETIAWSGMFEFKKEAQDDVLYR